jgi:ubiquinone biosynthesis accessory factor UbiJ
MTAVPFFSAPPAAKALIISAVETAFNRYLQLDDDLNQKLGPLIGKVIALNISNFDVMIYVSIHAHGVNFLDLYPGEADARISGSAQALGLMGLSATPMRALFKGDVQLEGDAQVARRFQRLLDELNADPEPHLARYLGNALAASFMQNLRGSSNWLHHCADSFRWNLQEFLQEESRELPTQAEAQHVWQAIDDTRDDIERMQARIERLTTRQD